MALPGGIYVPVGIQGVYYPDGRETQRIGIVPDIWMEPTIKGIREGRDEVLEKAIELINEIEWRNHPQLNSNWSGKLITKVTLFLCGSL